MQYEAAAKINRTQAVPPSSQAWNTHRTAEVVTYELKDTNTRRRRHILHQCGQEPVQLLLAKATESGMPQLFFQWRCGDRSGRI
jgi:hypothetical protein